MLLTTGDLLCGREDAPRRFHFLSCVKGLLLAANVELHCHFISCFFFYGYLGTNFRSACCFKSILFLIILIAIALFPARLPVALPQESFALCCFFFYVKKKNGFTTVGQSSCLWAPVYCPERAMTSSKRRQLASCFVFLHNDVTQPHSYDRGPNRKWPDCGSFKDAQ